MRLAACRRSPRTRVGRAWAISWLGRITDAIDAFLKPVFSDRRMLEVLIQDLRRNRTPISSPTGAGSPLSRHSAIIPCPTSPLLDQPEFMKDPSQHTVPGDSEASRKSSSSEFISDLGHSSNALAPDGAAPEGLDLKTSEGYDWRVRTTAAACATVTVPEPVTPPAEAVTTAVPLLRAVTKPAESTAATPG